MNRTNLVCCFVSMMGLSGCLPDVSGDSPPSDQLNYPVGISTTTGDEYLLVANANFDSSYNAGTLVAMDLDKLDVIREGGGDNAWLSDNGLQMHVPAEALIDEESTLRIDGFASDLALTPKGNRAVIPVRGDSRHILIADVDVDKRNGRVLSCGEDSDLKCNGAHKVTSNDNYTLPNEPLQVTVSDFTRHMVDHEGNETVLTSTIGFSTHLHSGSVSAFLIENVEGKLDTELLGVRGGVVPEATGIAVDPISNGVYISGGMNPNQYVAVLWMDVGGTGGTFTKNPSLYYYAIKYGRDLYGGTDVRGVAVSQSGETAVIVTRTPSALLRIDTEDDKITDMVAIGADPSGVELYESEEGLFAFVASFKNDTLYIVELQTMQVFVRPTGAGPHAMAFDRSRQHVYIADFKDSTITILEANPPFNPVKVEGQDVQLVIGKPVSSHD